MFATILLYLTACTKNSKPVKEATLTGFYFDTYISIQINDHATQELLDGLKEKCIYYDNLFSETNTSSDIVAINNATDDITINEEVAYVLSYALDLSQKTDGIIDPSIYSVSKLWIFDDNNTDIPDANDINTTLTHVNHNNITVNNNIVHKNDPELKIALGFIAKGYIGEMLKQYLIDNGVKSAIIDLGGNIICIGQKSNNKAFTIGIQKPFSNDIITTVNIKNKSVVTSGTYQRYFTNNGKIYHHILDTTTGYPIDNNLLSVTIIGPDSMVCDALSTTVFCLGKADGINFIKNYKDYYAILVLDDYSIIYSSDY